MEFDKNAHEPEDKILDAEKKVVLNPINREDQIQAEQTDAEVAAAHVNGPAIANISNDTEATGTSAAAQSAEVKANQLISMHKAANPTQKLKFPISVIVMLVIIGVLLFALLYL